MTAISGVTFEDAWSIRIDSWSVIGIDALLRNKRAAGRDKDLVDVRALELIRSARRG